MSSEGSAYDNENNTTYVEHRRTTFRIVDNKMKEVDQWISEYKQKWIEEQKIANEKYYAWQKDFKENDPLYTTMMKLIKEFNLPAEEWQGWGVCYKGWSETCDRLEKRITQRFNTNPVINIEWGTEKEKIKVIQRDKIIWFDHSAEGMEDALNFVKKNSKKGLSRLLCMFFGSRY